MFSPNFFSASRRPRNFSKMPQRSKTASSAWVRKSRAWASRWTRRPLRNMAPASFKIFKRNPSWRCLTCNRGRPFTESVAAPFATQQRGAKTQTVLSGKETVGAYLGGLELAEWIWPEMDSGMARRRQRLVLPALYPCLCADGCGCLSCIFINPAYLKEWTMTSCLLHAVGQRLNP